MFLFDCPSTPPEHIGHIDSVSTPLGNVRFEARIGTFVTATQTVSAAYQLSDGVWAAGWYQAAFLLELLVCRLNLPDPSPNWLNGNLTDCWAGMWRLQTHAAVGPCLFTAVWEDGYTWKDCVPDSGEHLYSKTWQDEKTEVAIGTQDAELLAQRSDQGDYMPGKLRSFFQGEQRPADWRTCPYWQDEAHQELRYKGLTTPLPSIESGQRCQLHFVIAWAESNKQSITPSLAVDRSASEILAAAHSC